VTTASKSLSLGPQELEKSCLIYTFSEREFLSQHDMTVGVEFAIRLVSIENKSVKLQIWDTAGQESFRSVTSNYYRGSAGALLVYDITRRDTFQHLESWLRELQTHCDPVIMVVGNKADMADDIRQVSSEEGQLFAQQNGLFFNEVSAKDVDKVEDIFMTVAKSAFSQMANTQFQAGAATNISTTPQEKTESKCCG